MTSKHQIDHLLPLRPVVFAVLLVLRVSPLHGYAVMKRVNDHLGREALVGPGTLYRTLKELRDARWIEHTEAPRDTDEVDGRRQYYRLTVLGRQVVEAEARRVAALLRLGDLANVVSARVRG